MSTYKPELGQAVFGAPTGEHELPEYAQALFFGVWREIGRVFWNMNQRAFDSGFIEDPGIAGITVRPYRYDDSPESELPNFTFGDVEFRWYKYPGRGMSVNVDWTPDQWAAWFDAAMAAVRAHETAWDEARMPPQTEVDGGESGSAF